MKKYIYTLALAATTIFSGCGDEEFLQITPSNQLTKDEIFKTIESSNTLLTGMYRYLRDVPNNVGGNTDDYGMPAMMITFDAKGEDLTLPFHWHGIEYRYTWRTPTHARPRAIWGQMYELINNANNVIDALGVQDKQEAKALVAEAKVFRANCYFYLAQIYQQTYATSMDAPGVPMYLEPTSLETLPKGRGKLSEVYAQIVKDLDEALAGDLSTTSNQARIDDKVAHGIRARVALVMNDWAKASEHAKLAYAGGEIEDEATFKAGFNNYDTKGWLWGMPQSADQNPIWASFFSFYDHERASGYQHIFVNDKFVELFSDTDYRKSLLIDNDADGSLALGYKRYTSRKFRDQSDFGGDIPLMRVAEMYLIEAEAEAELGNSTAAQDALFILQSERDPSVVKSVKTGDELVAEILVERRKELHSEGFRLLDILRTQSPLVREGNHSLDLDLPAESPMFIYPIPQKEIDANPMINEADQNVWE